MAGRKGLWMALGLVTVAGGCMQHQTTTGGMASLDATVTGLPDGAVLKKESDKPQVPKAATCVAYGEFKSAEASAPDQSGERRDSMRDQAGRAYQQALQIDPKNLQAYLGLARLQTASGDFELAIVTLNKGLAFHPNSAAFWYDLGMAHGRRKEWELSLTALAKAAEFDPQNRQVVNMCGYALARTGRFDESLACFARVNGEAKAHYNLARMLEHLDQPELSKTHLRLALQADPRMAQAKALLVKMEGGAPATADDGRPVAAGQAASGVQPAFYTQNTASADAANPAPATAPAAVAAMRPVLLPTPPMTFQQPRKDATPKLIVTNVGEANPVPGGQP